MPKPDQYATIALTAHAAAASCHRGAAPPILPLPRLRGPRYRPSYLLALVAYGNGDGTYGSGGGPYECGLPSYLLAVVAYGTAPYCALRVSSPLATN